jgi:PKD repeat protein
VFGKLYRLTPNGASFTQTEFATIPDVVSMRFGPDGAGQSLYYVTRFGGELHRIRFTGSANRAPIARVTASPTSGPAPLAVGFDGGSSSDPDGDTLAYDWDFDDNGSTDATGPTASHTYTDPGSYTARLTVRDPAGAEGSDTVTIGAGNTPPTPAIESPAQATLFAVGEAFTLRGSATTTRTAISPTSASSGRCSATTRRTPIRSSTRPPATTYRSRVRSRRTSTRRRRPTSRFA